MSAGGAARPHVPVIRLVLGVGAYRPGRYALAADVGSRFSRLRRTGLEEVLR